MPSSSSARCGARAHARRGRAAEPRVGSRPRQMLAATSRRGTRSSSWKIVAMPAPGRRAASRCETAGAVDAISPLSAGCDAGEDVHQRRLAGAVLAEQRVHFAGVAGRAKRRKERGRRERISRCRASRAGAESPASAYCCAFCASAFVNEPTFTCTTAGVFLPANASWIVSIVSAPILSGY